MKTKYKNKQSGFSLVETIVAIAILAFCLVGPMTAAQRSLLSASYSRDQMKAYYLAEEGLEYIHYIRDGNTLNGDNWLKDLNNCISAESGGGSQNACGIDPFNPSQSSKITNCNNVDTDENICKLYFSASTGIYSLSDLSGFLPTVFRRWVKIYTTVGGVALDPDERRVVSTVSWRTGPLNVRTISVTGFIHDWKKQPAN